MESGSLPRATPRLNPPWSSSERGGGHRFTHKHLLPAPLLLLLLPLPFLSLLLLPFLSLLLLLLLPEGEMLKRPRPLPFAAPRRRSLKRWPRGCAPTPPVSPAGRACPWPPARAPSPRRSRRPRCARTIGAKGDGISPPGVTRGV